MEIGWRQDGGRTEIVLGLDGNMMEKGRERDTLTNYTLRARWPKELTESPAQGPLAGSVGRSAENANQQYLMRMRPSPRPGTERPQEYAEQGEPRYARRRWQSEGMSPSHLIIRNCGLHGAIRQLQRCACASLGTGRLLASISLSGRLRTSFGVSPSL